METAVKIVRFLPKYLTKILEVWVVWVWFFVLDALGLVVDTFVPTFSPPRWLYWAIAGVGFALANVKLLLDYEVKLADYEYQAPEYDIDVTGVEVDICRRACHVNVYCDISIRPTTPWIGYLVKVTVDRDHQIRGLSNWQVSGVWSANNRVSSWPLQIPDRVLNLRIQIQSETSEQIDPSESDKWKEVVFPLKFMIMYFTQPVGEVQKLEIRNAQADLEEALRSVLRYQERAVRR